MSLRVCWHALTNLKRVHELRHQTVMLPWNPVTSLKHIIHKRQKSWWDNTSWPWKMTCQEYGQGRFGSQLNGKWRAYKVCPICKAIKRAMTQLSFHPMVELLRLGQGQQLLLAWDSQFQASTASNGERGWNIKANPEQCTVIVSRVYTVYPNI